MLHECDDYIGGFLDSPEFLFLNPELKEHAPGLLGAFAQGLSQAGVGSLARLTISSLEDVLVKNIAPLPLPVAIRRSAPIVVRYFFSYLAQSCFIPGASAWGDWLDIVDKKYQDKIRDNGSLRGETFKKNYTEVHRNDPCPCGSKKKFKKCCSGLTQLLQ